MITSPESTRRNAGATQALLAVRGVAAGPSWQKFSEAGEKCPCCGSRRSVTAAGAERGSPLAAHCGPTYDPWLIIHNPFVILEVGIFHV